jgi:hypothetical protein
MSTLVLRELQLIARERAFRTALFLHAAVIAAVVLIWSTGSIRDAEFVVLAALLPWAAARLMSTRTSTDGARAIAAVLALGLIVAAAFPLLLIAQRLDSADIRFAIRAEIQGQLLSVLTVVLVLAWRRLSKDRLIGWIGATVSTIAFVIAALDMGWGQ